MGKQVELAVDKVSVVVVVPDRIAEEPVVVVVPDTVVEEPAAGVVVDKAA